MTGREIITKRVSVHDATRSPSKPKRRARSEQPAGGSLLAGSSPARGMVSPFVPCPYLPPPFSQWCSQCSASRVQIRSTRVLPDANAASPNFVASASARLDVCVSDLRERERASTRGGSAQKRSASGRRRACKRESAFGAHERARTMIPPQCCYADPPHHPAARHGIIILPREFGHPRQHLLL